MTCEIPRTYLPVPQLLNTGDSLPSVPTNPNDWDGMRRLLEAIRQSVGGSSTAQNTTAPPQVTNFVATSKLGGTLLTWDFNLNGGYYILYRGTSNDLRNAYTMGLITEGNTRRGQFIDPCGQDTAGTIIYYWIQPFTLGGVPGALTSTNKACVSCGVTPVVTWSDTLKNIGGQFMGVNWDVNYTPNSNTGGVTLDGAVNSGATGMTYGSVGGIGASGYAAFFPSQVDNKQIIAQSTTYGQYVQLRFVAQSAAVNTNLFISTMATIFEVGYSMTIATATPGTVGLRRDNGNFGAGTALDTNLMTIVAGDLMRMETRVVGSTVEITTYKNGVFNKLTVDSSAQRLTSGRAGILLVGSQPNSTFTMSDYDGGSFSS